MTHCDIYGPKTQAAALQRLLEAHLKTVPHAITTGASRIDHLATGLDDCSRHKALIDTTWGSDWDDLGGSFNSAPVANLDAIRKCGDFWQL